MTRSRFVIRKKGTQHVLMANGSRLPERFDHINISGCMPVLYLFRVDAHRRRKKLVEARECEVVPVSINIEES